MNSWVLTAILACWILKQLSLLIEIGSNHSNKGCGSYTSYAPYFITSLLVSHSDYTVTLLTLSHCLQMQFVVAISTRADLWSQCLVCVCGPSGKRKVRNFCSNLSCINWSCWSGWRIWATVLLMMIYLAFSLIWLSSLTYTFITYEPFSSFKTWYVASFFVLATTAMFLITLRQHWVHYTRPNMQRYIIRIAFFVHSYGFYSVSISSLISLCIT